MEDTPSVSSSIDPYFYKRVAQQAVDSGWAHMNAYKNDIYPIKVETMQKININQYIGTMTRAL